MLATSVLVSPCSERCSLPSDGRRQTMVPPSTLIVIWEGRPRSSLPLGPSTVTWFLCTSTFTPLGTGMGSLPILDISPLSLPLWWSRSQPFNWARRLPDVGQDLASHSGPLRLQA